LAANPAEANQDIVRAMDITGRLLKLDAAVALVLSGELMAQLGRREKALELNPAAIERQIASAALPMLEWRRWPDQPSTVARKNAFK
jgi:hypothetical protein